MPGTFACQQVWAEAKRKSRKILNAYNSIAKVLQKRQDSKSE